MLSLKQAFSQSTLADAIQAIFILVFLFVQKGFSTDQPSRNDGNFTIVGGQIYTPGLVIVDAPQPFTPLGGDFLQLALDISGDGALPFPPPNSSNSPTFLSSVTLFLTSYTTNLNLTISNSSSPSTSSSSPQPPSPPLSNILTQEPSSTVKHVNYLWPSCLVSNSSARGPYNISIHQTFRLNSSADYYYTVFDLPVSVTNAIPQAPNSAVGDKPAPGPAGRNGERLSCDVLSNPLLSQEEVRHSTRTPGVQPFLGGGVSVSGTDSSNNGNGGIDSTGSDQGQGKGLGNMATALREHGRREVWAAFGALTWVFL